MQIRLMELLFHQIEITQQLGGRLHSLQKRFFRFNNHDDKSLLLQSLTSDSEG